MHISKDIYLMDWKDPNWSFTMNKGRFPFIENFPRTGTEKKIFYSQEQKIFHCLVPYIHADRKVKFSFVSMGVLSVTTKKTILLRKLLTEKKRKRKIWVRKVYQER